jgi:predicted CoA-binding protein
MKTVVVLGASDKPERKSNEAVKLLKEKGYRVVPVHPSLETLHGIPVTRTLAEAPDEPEVLTVYINPGHSALMADDIVRLSPETVIFNPGSESDELEARLVQNGIRTLHACTLVLLKTGQFETAISE